MMSPITSNLDQTQKGGEISFPNGVVLEHTLNAVPSNSSRFHSQLIRQSTK